MQSVSDMIQIILYSTQKWRAPIKPIYSGLADYSILIGWDVCIIFPYTPGHEVDQHLQKFNH
uniref:Uncharacterized protein n=1 Tax=Anguilla anguilla TaxID=7936 RepID=A0A0E9SH87_ANGAN